MEVAEKLILMAPELMAKSTQIAMRHYGQMGEIILKDDNSPLTQADLEVDRYLYAELTKAFPDIPIVTEERANSHDLDVSSGMFFLVDPIDGTKEFINKRDEFTVNVALLDNRKPISGIVGVPALSTYYTGQIGKGAHELNMNTGTANSIAVRKPDNEALLVVASRSHLTPQTQAFIEANKVADIKNGGSSLKFCLLARGDADLYPRFGPTMEWDTAAGHAVLLAAGGAVDNLDGTPLNYAKPEFKNPSFIASVAGVEFKMSV